MQTRMVKILKVLLLVVAAMNVASTESGKEAESNVDASNGEVFEYGYPTFKTLVTGFTTVQLALETGAGMLAEPFGETISTALPFLSTESTQSTQEPAQSKKNLVLPTQELTLENPQTLGESESTAQPLASAESTQSTKEAAQSKSNVELPTHKILLENGAVLTAKSSEDVKSTPQPLNTESIQSTPQSTENILLPTHKFTLEDVPTKPSVESKSTAQPLESTEFTQITQEPARSKENVEITTHKSGVDADALAKSTEEIKSTAQPLTNTESTRSTQETAQSKENVELSSGKLPNQNDADDLAKPNSNGQPFLSTDSTQITQEPAQSKENVELTTYKSKVDVDVLAKSTEEMKSTARPFKNIESTQKPHKDAVLSAYSLRFFAKATVNSDCNIQECLICSLSEVDRCLEPLTLKGKGTRRGYPVVLGDEKRVMFRSMPDGSIKHVRSGLCLDGSGEFPILHECNGQVWESIGNEYIFAVKSNGKCVTMEDFYLVMSECTFEDDQKFFLRTFPLDQFVCRGTIRNRICLL